MILKWYITQSQLPVKLYERILKLWLERYQLMAIASYTDKTVLVLFVQK